VNVMKEYDFCSNSRESHIKGWTIDGEICDGLIQLFKDNKDHHVTGVIGGPYNVNKEHKDSIDLALHPDWDELRFVAYKDALKKCLKLYENHYPEIKGFTKYSMTEGANIQYYPPCGGYFVDHCERTSAYEKRCLVWMTYLNDVPDAGTHFKYQKVTTPAEKGLTLIWPTDFTHTHKGQISKIHGKYIITGWMGYIDSMP
jgi:prolyl 4-hydroxylase